MPVKILILDEEDKADVLSIRLRSLGYTVTVFPGLDGLAEKLESFDPRAVICEAARPGIKAVDFLQSLHPEKRFIYVYTQALDLSAFQVPGVKASFSKTRRADMISAIQKDLPLEPVAAPRAPAAIPALEFDEACPSQRGFLLVEDSATVRLYLRQALSTLYPGLAVTEAADGRAALRQLTQRRFDLIITDMQMPGMDGHAFVKVLKDNPVLAKKPVLICSNAVDADLKAAFAAYANVRLLPKPATADSLKAEIDALLGPGPSLPPARP